MNGRGGHVMQFLKNIISIILSFIIIGMLYVLFLIGNVSSFFSVQSIEKTTSNIDVVHEIEKIKNSSVIAGQKAEIVDIINTAYDEAERHGISKDLVDVIFNSTEVKEFLGHVVGTTTDYVINNRKGEVVTSEDFNKLLDANIDKWIDESNIEISDSKKEVLVIRIKQASAGIVDNLPNTSMVDDKIDGDKLAQVQFIFSSKVKVALVVLIVLCLILIFFLNKNKNKWLIYLFMSLLITGLITIATGFITTDIVTLALNEYNLSFMINAFSSSFSHSVLITGIVSVFIAIIMLVVYCLLNKRKDN